MFEIFLIASVWLFLAIISTIIANKLKISIALIEITIGAIFGLIAIELNFVEKIHANSEWLRFVASSGAILLTFLAGAELEPEALKKRFNEVSVVGIIGFLAPFIGATLISYYFLQWDLRASLLVGVALSTTSMAVVYSVMLEYGFNKTLFGKGVLGACFINDLGTVIALGLIFSPFTYRTVIFIAVVVLLIFILNPITEFLTKHFAYKTSAIRTKWILFILFATGSLAVWSGSEAVLPAYILGMVLASIINKDNFFIRRLRTLTIGFLTPFYFLRAGFLMSIPAIISYPIIFLVLFLAKVISKIFGLYPVIRKFREDTNEKWFYTLLMSTGLTFGTISALFGLTNGIITKDQYSIIVAVVIASAVIPTLIANKFFLPSHLLEKPLIDEELSQEEI
ncbi:MAG: cation:proton antiporter [Candidatus Kapabacteria bacterium]|nr:cation:proton antiporter [Candidatus Kapabacteria bacterium]